MCIPPVVTPSCLAGDNSVFEQPVPCTSDNSFNIKTAHSIKTLPTTEKYYTGSPESWTRFTADTF